jgi:hypothetical protein
MKRIGHWQDIVSVVMGVWLIVSPWVLGVHAPLQAIGNFVAIGIVLGAFALTEMFIPEAWEEWSELVLGAWLIASPWVLEFTDMRVAVQNAVACGLVVSVLALWVIGTDGAFGGWLRRRAR